MTFFERYRYWIAKPLLDALRSELTQTAVDQQREAQREAYSLGRTHGEFLGQQHILGEMSRFLDERHAESPEITRDDIERAKKGLVH